MANSFISLHGKGLWISDIYLELFAALFVAELDERSQILPSWLHGIRKKYRIIQTGALSSFVNLEFDTFDQNEERIFQYILILDCIVLRIKAGPKVIRKDHLNSNKQPDQSEWIEDLKASDIVHLVNCVRKIVLSDVATTSGDPDSYFIV